MKNTNRQIVIVFEKLPPTASITWDSMMQDFVLKEGSVPILSLITGQNQNDCR